MARQCRGFRGYAVHFVLKCSHGSQIRYVRRLSRTGAAVAKFWLYPEVCLAESYGLNRQEQGTLAGIVAERRQEIEEAWHGFFS
ncbi:MAG: DUF4160 domain-containing protein [Acidithiobacillus sp.]